MIEALLYAARHYADQARTTPHTMHVDDHRGKAERLAVTAADLHRLRFSFRPQFQALARSVRSKLRARLDRKDDDG